MLFIPKFSRQPNTNQIQNELTFKNLQSIEIEKQSTKNSLVAEITNQQVQTIHKSYPAKLSKKHENMQVSDFYCFSFFSATKQKSKFKIWKRKLKLNF